LASRVFDFDSKQLMDLLDGAIYGRRFARYVLLRLEYLLASHAAPLNLPDEISVEHILPQTPGKANAVYHRSYEEREPIEVRISNEELVILSFPGPDRSIRLEDFQAGRAVSRRYRNRRIGEFLKELDLTEGRSTGIPKILKVMAANGSPAPLFESDEDRLSFVIRLPCHPLARSVPPEVTGEVAPEVTPEVAPEVVRVVLALHEELSRTGLQQALDLKDEKHFRKAYLLPALASGLVEMTRPETPRSSKQRYRRTRLGQRWLETHQGNSAC